MNEVNAENGTAPKRGLLNSFHKIPKGLKVFLAGILFVVVVLVCTNPTMNGFKEFLPTKLEGGAFNSSGLKCARTRNWLIFSVYEYEYNWFDMESYSGDKVSKGQFCGIFNNFFELVPSTTSEVQTNNDF